MYIFNECKFKVIPESAQKITPQVLFKRGLCSVHDKAKTPKAIMINSFACRHLIFELIHDSNNAQPKTKFKI